MKLSNLIKDNYVYFDFLRIDTMYYKIQYEGDWYQFPVSLNDVGNGTMQYKDKAILFMRWIRKAIEKKEFVKL